MPWLTLENNWNMDRAASSRMLCPSRGSAGLARSVVSVNGITRW
jgi:hypothetical protein